MNTKLKPFYKTLLLSFFSASFIIACGDVGEKTNTTQNTGGSVTATGNGDGVVDLGPDTEPTPTVIEDLDSLLIGVRDINKHKRTEKHLLGIISEDLQITETYEFELQISTLGVNGTSPLPNISDVIDVSVTRKRTEIIGYASHPVPHYITEEVTSPVIISTDKLALVNGQGKQAIRAQFPDVNPWVEGEQLIITAHLPDSDATDNVNDERTVQYIAFIERTSQSILP